jgi:uncharacterized protein YbjT (DUF2867 family)
MTRGTILVTGGTGQQGGAVIRHLRATGRSIRALVRNPQSPAAIKLAGQGVELTPGDFDQPDSLAKALHGTTAVFSVQPILRGKSHVEAEWGKRIADLAHKAGVEHFVYSSVLGADQAPEVPHFASKFEIERHIRSIGLPCTILRPAGFMDNLLMPVVRKGLAKGKLTAPNNLDAPQPLIAVDDIGGVAALALSDPQRFIGQTIPLVAEALSTRQQAEILSRVLGREIKPGKLPALITRIFLGADLYAMFRWIDQKAGKIPFDPAKVRTLYPQLTSFEDWCRRNLAT